MRTAHTRKMVGGLAAIATAAGLVALPAGAAAGSAVPPLSALPGALTANGALKSAPLAVALPAHASPAAVRAAMVAAGAVARSEGGDGVRVIAVEGATPAELLQSPGPVLAINERPGPGSLALSRLSTGKLELTVSGGRNSLLAAARLLSSPWLKALSGVSATVPPGVGAAARQTPATPSGATIAPRSAAGTRTLHVSSTFSMPVDQIVTKGQAEIRVGVSYGSPTGGQVQISLNGNALGSYTVPPGGGTFRVSTFNLSSNWTANGNLLPGYFLTPGRNKLTVTASPPPGHRTGNVVSHLALETGSDLVMSTAPRPATEQLSLWPFPFYGAHAWTRTTVVMPRNVSSPVLSGLIGAMANAERVTGVPSDPAVTYDAPTAAQRSNNLIVIGNPTIAALAYNGPLLSGLLAEMPIIMGGNALIAYDARALNALGYGYEPGDLAGRVVLINANGAATTLVSAPAPGDFSNPPHPWIAPAALIALLVLGWLTVHARLARRRLIEMPDLPLDGGHVAS